MAAKKKDLQGTISKGVDVFFSANDDAHEEHTSHEVHDTQEVQEQDVVQEVHGVRKPYKAQEATIEQLDAVIYTMQEQIVAAEARRTQGRKGLKMPRLNMSITPSSMDYLRVMSGVSGMTVTRFINHIIEQHAAAYAERYQKAKELMRDE